MSACLSSPPISGVLVTQLALTETDAEGGGKMRPRQADGAWGPEASGLW